MLSFEGALPKAERNLISGLRVWPLGTHIFESVVYIEVPDVLLVDDIDHALCLQLVQQQL